MPTGGYKIIDLNGFDISKTAPVKVDGIYEELESTRKTVLIKNFLKGDVEIAPFFGSLFNSSDSYFIVYNVDTSSFTRFYIKSDDTVQYQTLNYTVNTEASMSEAPEASV